jgi:hypothetical protein
MRNSLAFGDIGNIVLVSDAPVSRWYCLKRGLLARLLCLKSLYFCRGTIPKNTLTVDLERPQMQSESEGKQTDLVLFRMYPVPMRTAGENDERSQ